MFFYQTQRQRLTMSIFQLPNCFMLKECTKSPCFENWLWLRSLDPISYLHCRTFASMREMLLRATLAFVNKAFSQEITTSKLSSQWPIVWCNAFVQYLQSSVKCTIYLENVIDLNLREQGGPWHTSLSNAKLGVKVMTTAYLLHNVVYRVVVTTTIRSNTDCAIFGNSEISFTKNIKRMMFKLFLPLFSFSNYKQKPYLSFHFVFLSPQWVREHD